MSKNKKFSFGFRGEVNKDTAESRIIPFVLSTFTKDRYHTVLNQDGWQLDNYRKNPVVAYQHNLSGGLCSDPDPNFIIGKSLREYYEGAGNEKKLMSEAQFEPQEINELAETIFRKVLFGSLGRTSVGFLEVGHGKYGEGDQARDAENETYYFAGQELLEYSVVNIPANPDAGRRDMMRRMREESYGALMYAWKELGGKFRISQIEQFRVCDILDLLDGKDLEIRTTDPDEVRRLMKENASLKDQVARLNLIMNRSNTSL